MKQLITATILFLSFVAQAQIDTVIKNDIYQSYFSYKYHEPVYVTYKLYQAGGDCSRVGDVFKTGGLKQSATAKDYSHSGYDEGHLADSKDFAFDCKKQEETFRFYNCVPQTPNLNRGVWKHYETEIRIASQFDSLLVICGSTFTNKVLPNTQVAIPDYCWKVVQFLNTKEVKYCLLFTNTIDNNIVKVVTLQDLQTQLGYILPLKQ